MSLYFEDSMIWMHRSGKDDDPFIPIQQTVRIKDGTVLLEEIPDSFQRPIVTHDTITFSEVQSGDIGETNYRIIYKYGIIVFNHANNGELVTVNYFGTGKFFLPSSRVYTQVDDSNNIIQTIQNLIDSGETALGILDNVASLVNEINEFEHKGQYKSTTLYEKHNVVDDGNGSSYMAIKKSVGQSLSNTTYWRVVSLKGDKGDKGEKGNKGDKGDKGINWKGNYNSATTYVIDDAVFYPTTGSSYVCILGSTGKLPTNTTYWEMLASKGADGTGTGAGDMSKATYDQNNNGIVDNAEKLGGKLPSYYEPAFAKNTAFNKNFGTTTGTVCSGDHLSNYESPHLYEDEGDNPDWVGVKYRIVMVNGEAYMEVVDNGTS